MSFDAVNPQNIPPMIQHNQMRLVQGGSLLDKPTGWDKFKLGITKFGAVFTRMAASVLRFIPGFGTIASAGLYGISNLAQYGYEKQVGNRLNELARDESAAMMDYSQVVLPGFGMFSRPQGADVADGLGQDKLGVVLNREIAARSEVSGLSG